MIYIPSCLNLIWCIKDQKYLFFIVWKYITKTKILCSFNCIILSALWEESCLVLLRIKCNVLINLRAGWFSSRLRTKVAKKVGCLSYALFNSLAIYRLFLPNCLLEPLSVTASEILASFSHCKVHFRVLHGKIWKWNILFSVRKQKGCEVSWGRRWQKWAVFFGLCMLSVVSHGLLSTWMNKF